MFLFKEGPRDAFNNDRPLLLYLYYFTVLIGIVIKSNYKLSFRVTDLIRLPLTKT